MISPDEFTQKMSRIESMSKSAPEVAGREADDLVANLLKQLGYDGGASIWERMVEN